MKKVKDEDILVGKVDLLTAGYLNNTDTINYILDNAVFKDSKKSKEPGKLIKWISYVLTSLLFLVIGLGLVWLIVQIIKHL